MVLLSKSEEDRSLLSITKSGLRESPRDGLGGLRNTFDVIHIHGAVDDDCWCGGCKRVAALLHSSYSFTPSPLLLYEHAPEVVCYRWSLMVAMVVLLMMIWCSCDDDTLCLPPKLSLISSNFPLCALAVMVLGPDSDGGRECC